MQTFTIDPGKRTENLRNLRNHRIKVICLMFISSWAIFAVMDSVEFYRSRYFISTLVYLCLSIAGISYGLRPNGQSLQDFEVQLREDRTIATYYKGKRIAELNLSQMKRLRESPRGLRLYKTLPKLWIPSSINNYDELKENLTANLPQKKNFFLRNPVLVIGTIIWILGTATFLLKEPADIETSAVFAIGWIANVIFYLYWE